MGISTVLTSSIVLYVLLVATGIIIGLFLQQLDYLTHAATVNNDYLLKREVINIRDWSYNESTNVAYITMNVSNDGNTLIYDYEKIDIIMTLTVNSSYHVFTVPFKGSVAEINTSTLSWYVEGIYDASNLFRRYNETSPIYWEPNTSIKITIAIPQKYIPDNSTSVTITIATAGGGEDFLRFTWIAGG